MNKPNTPHHREDFVFIDFVGKVNFWFPFSMALTGIAIVLLLVKGLNYGIDFAGGTEIQLRFNNVVQSQDVRDFLAAEGVKDAGLQQFSSKTGSEYLIRLEAIQNVDEKQANVELKTLVDKITAGLKQKYGQVEILRVDTVGPQVGSELKRDGILALFYSLLLILIYIGLRFDARFAPGAVLCLFHDAVVTLGIFSLFHLEVNVQILAAVLTIVGYSLNDTIVVYDRIRENIHGMVGVPVGDVINTSINETMGRTILTSLTTFLASLALYLFAGGVIENFALAMMVGIFLGTYSSIYVASPFIIWVEKWRGSHATTPTTAKATR